LTTLSAPVIILASIILFFKDKILNLVSLHNLGAFKFRLKIIGALIFLCGGKQLNRRRVYKIKEISRNVAIPDTLILISKCINRNISWLMALVAGLKRLSSIKKKRNISFSISFNFQT